MTVHPAIFAVAVVLVASAAGSGDYELMIEHEVATICAKSETACEQARFAIGQGWWLPGVDARKTRCQAHPGCFSPESNCIQNFNCGSKP